MIKGACGDHEIVTELLEGVKGDEDETLYGLCHKDGKKARITLSIDTGMCGQALLNTFLHEAIHGADFVFGLSLEHSEVYTLASALTQIVTTSGLITPDEFEARIRRLAAPEPKE